MPIFPFSSEAEQQDLSLVINIILDKTIEQLNVHAADILYFESNLSFLTCIGAKGFQSREGEQLRLRLGDSCAGRAFQEGKTLFIKNIQKENQFTRRSLVREEGLKTYIAVPMNIKGQIIGVLEVFKREEFSPDPEWQDFLETIAGQIAIAIDNINQFNNVNRLNRDILLAYDRTLEGWAHALSLKDEETQEHNERDTNLTVEMCKQLNIPDNQLQHVWRGALLHDIGKMGIPDSILLKKGKLTDEELSIMQKHPVYAYEFLKKIDFLQQAVDIPYCHHEKWDGSGYPRGLKREEIPLVARIFAVVDVWDALISDRPYRKAWSRKKALDYIKGEAGTYFDPKVVDAFMKLIGNPN